MKAGEMKYMRILGMDNNWDVLSEMASVIRSTWPECFFDRARSYDEGLQRMLSYTYNLVIADPNHQPGSRLVDQAVTCQFPMLALVDNEKYAWSARTPHESPIRAIIPKSRVNDITAVIKDIIESEYSSAWKRGLLHISKRVKLESSLKWMQGNAHGTHRMRIHRRYGLNEG